MTDSQMGKSKNIQPDDWNLVIENLPLSQLVKIYSELSGDAEEFLFTQLLMLFSRNLGHNVAKPSISVPNVDARPNLYAMLVAMPQIFHKSSIIRKEKELRDRIVERVKGTDKIQEISLQFEGTFEGLIDEQKRYEKIDYNNDEFSRIIKLDASKNNSKSNTIQILIDGYYGNAYTRSLRDKKDSTISRVDVPAGRYITFFGAMHENEFTPDLYHNGLMRRCIIIHLKPKDAKPSNAAFNPGKIESLKSFESALVDKIAGARKELIFRSYHEELIEDGFNVDGTPNFNIVYKEGKKPEFSYEDAAVKYLSEIHIRATERAIAEESQLSPDENVEMIMRIAINLMLWDFVRNNSSPLVVTLKHVKEAEDFLTKIAKNYKEDVAELEDRDLSVKVRRLIEYVEKHCTVEQPYIREGDVVNGLKARRWGDQSEKSVRQAIRENKVKRFTQKYAKTTGYILTPIKFLGGTIEQLEKQKKQYAEKEKEFDYYEPSGRTF